MAAAGLKLQSIEESSAKKVRKEEREAYRQGGSPQGSPGDKNMR